MLPDPSQHDSLAVFASPWKIPVMLQSDPFNTLAVFPGCRNVHWRQFLSIYHERLQQIKGPSSQQRKWKLISECAGEWIRRGGSFYDKDFNDNSLKRMKKVESVLYVKKALHYFQKKQPAKPKRQRSSPSEKQVATAAMTQQISESPGAVASSTIPTENVPENPTQPPPTTEEIPKIQTTTTTKFLGENASRQEVMKDPLAVFPCCRNVHWRQHLSIYHERLQEIKGPGSHQRKRKIISECAEEWIRKGGSFYDKGFCEDFLKRMKKPEAVALVKKALQQKYQRKQPDKKPENQHQQVSNSLKLLAIAAAIRQQSEES